MAKIKTNELTGAALDSAAKKLAAALEDMLDGPDDLDGNGHCIYCGRDMEEEQRLCSSDDCHGHNARAALAAYYGEE